MSDSVLGIFLESLLHVREELVGDRSVDDAVIERNREIRARADGDGILAICARDHLRALLDGADSKNRDLRLVDDRRTHE